MKLLQETLQRIKKSFLSMQTDERFYIPPPNFPKCAQVTTVPPLHGHRHQKHPAEYEIARLVARFIIKK